MTSPARTTVRWRRSKVPSVSACLLLCVWITALSVKGQAQDHGGDRQALIALYNATDGENWENNHNWLSDEPLSTWFGVILSGGRVQTLALHYNELTGTLPAELGNLSHLKVLALNENQLAGPIPAELGRLVNLTDLDLSRNRRWVFESNSYESGLEGSIPAELGGLANLEALRLSDNRLSGPIPTELGNLASLEVLDLSVNKLTGPIPAELGRLASLSYLDLSFNRQWVFESDTYEGGLEGSIPAELSGLANLEDLRLISNRLTGPIPAELVNLANLVSLSLSENQLTGPIPAELGNLANLEYLFLADNQLTGAIPAELGSIANLWSLDLYSNRLTGSIPAALGSLSNLGRLHLANNRLTGPIPAALGSLSNLGRLYLSGNQLTGTIPAELGDLADLEQLSLSHNRLTGPIPAALAKLSNLVVLSLHNNRLTGPIPVKLGALANLESLYLPNNRLTGSIPAELGALTDLWQLNLSGNRLTGPIPAELGNLSSLNRLSLADNQLTGAIPAELGTLAHLRRLDLSGNRLTGAIPESFTSLTLEHFYFHGNPGLSVPIDFAFREWLGGIAELRDQDYSPSTPFVPVILSAAGRKNSYFTSELTLTNRGTVPALLTYAYTAHFGGGSGIAHASLGPGRQRVVPDAIKYLKERGAPIPDTGNRIGTLRVEFRDFSSSDVAVTVRTTTTVPDGRAGLAYPAVSAEAGFEEAVYLCGLRQSEQDRSNVAFQHMGTAADGPITLRTTVYSGDPNDTSPRLLGEVTLAPGGFYQYSGVLDTVANGFVKVERVSGAAPFYAYGVINDQANSDGSFVFPVTASSLEGTVGQTLPVIVEAGVFTSELMVTNFSDQPKLLMFSATDDAIETEGNSASFGPLPVAPGQQYIIPNVIEAARQQFGLNLPRGLQIPLSVSAVMGDMSGIAIGARTGSPGGGGQYGVFYNAVPYGGGFVDGAWVEALQQNEENRSNLALVNTGEVDPSPSVFQLDIYDGKTGELVNTVTGLRVEAGAWRQIDTILGNYAPDTTQGYVRISKTAGNNPFLAYGVINDGGAPGQRSDDGAYLPARQ